WTETQTGVSVDEGFFSVYLGDETELPVDVLVDAQELWLSMTVGGEELSRVQLASVPYALEARMCRQIGDLEEDDVQPILSDDNACEEGTYLRGWNADAGVPICDPDMINDGGTAAPDWNAMINIPSGFADNTDDGFTDEPALTALIDDNYAASVHEHDTTYVNEGQADSITSGMITNGEVTSDDLDDGACLAEILDDDGTGSGLDADLLDGNNADAFATAAHDHFGETWTGSSANIGLWIENQQTSGTSYGVYVTNASTDGRGVYGYTTDPSGETYGVFGRSSSTNGRGVYGYVEAASGPTVGIYGFSQSTAGYGVHGIAYASSGTTYGVAGHNYSENGYGVYGHNHASTGYNYGVYGRSDSTSGMVCAGMPSPRQARPTVFSVRAGHRKEPACTVGPLARQARPTVSTDTRTAPAGMIFTRVVTAPTMLPLPDPTRPG
ncbi:MAG: hypothetical protein GY854_08195, partial [Deltaproteobacteria bacterium]|nr:hypothetical protein [Deltaproteobacteria bacterium]